MVRVEHDLLDFLQEAVRIVGAELGDHGTMVGFTAAFVGIMEGCCCCCGDCWLFGFLGVPAAEVVVGMAGCSEAEVE